MFVADHWFKRFINHQWVIAIGASLVPFILNSIASLGWSGHIGEFFKAFGVVLGFTFDIPLWLVLTAIFLVYAIIIRLQDREPREYTCERDCTYHGKYVKEGTRLITTEKNPAHFSLVK
jgi:hypothetical protein